MLGTRMKEASVDEDCHAAAGEYDIRSYDDSTGAYRVVDAKPQPGAM